VEKVLLVNAIKKTKIKKFDEYQAKKDWFAVQDNGELNRKGK
jgi:hypothetical protein